MARFYGICFTLSILVALSGCATTKVAEGPPAVLDLVLVPMPRSVVPGSGSYASDSASEYRFENVDTNQVTRLQNLLQDIHALLGTVQTIGTSFKVNLCVDAAQCAKAEGYVLDISPRQIQITGHDDAGVFYGVMTLKQLARQFSGTGALPCLRIEDWPDFPNRGAMLDVARCKVPEMETLYAQVDKFAELKFNQLQMYTEHTFAYSNHHTVWEDASPMTPAQIRALDAYCRDQFIELVPNQNSFGHMGRWLGLLQYAHLAETPGGGDLCPIDPASIALIEDMYGDLLPCFSSGQANVGCDETWSLGKGRSKEACDARGVGRVYFEFLMKINDVCAKHGKQMQFWGDIIMNHPELIPEIPDGVIAMEWGYEAMHPFAEHGKKFAESGVPFYVVPGTSSWNTLVGRTDNALANLRNAAENGLANGAIGYLITDWGDGGHWQFQPVSYLPFAYGAAVSWCVEANKDTDIARAVDMHWFEDDAGVMGRFAYDLGNAHMKSGVTLGNCSVFYPLLSYGLDGPLSEAYTVEGLRNTLAAIDELEPRLDGADMQCADAALIEREFRLAMQFMRLACRLGIARLENGNGGTAQIPAAARHVLADELRPLIPEFRQVWLERNRSGGLKESAGHFERLLAILEAK